MIPNPPPDDSDQPIDVQIADAEKFIKVNHIEHPERAYEFGDVVRVVKVVVLVAVIALAGTYYLFK